MNRVLINDRTVDLATGTVLATNGQSEQLPARVLRILKLLLDAGGEVVERDRLLEQVWGHIEAGSDDALNVAVSNLRKALGDGQRPYQLVQTVPRRGYAWCGPAPTPAADAVPGSESPIRARQHRRPAVWAATITAILVLTLAGWRFSGREVAPLGAPIQPFVAVLPFEDFSDAGDQSAFAEGLTDTVLHMLAQTQDLKVMARTSTYAFRGGTATIAEIAEELGVTVVLEGSVQRSQDNVRVVAQLINAEDQRHLWSRTYDRPAGDIFAIQDDIAASVAREMELTLAPAALEKKMDLEAYEELALGRAQLGRLTVEASEAAVSHLERAVELAPRSVEALVRLADALAAKRKLKQGIGGRSTSTPSARELKLLDEAAALDPQSPYVLRAQADRYAGNNQISEALDAYRNTVAKAPSYAEAYASYGRLLYDQARYEEALSELRLARQLDPLNDQVNAWLADALWAVGRSEEALARLRENIKRTPNFPLYHDQIATYLNQLGRTGEAMRHIRAQWDLDPGNPARHFRVCEFYLQLADDLSAEACAEELMATHPDQEQELYLRQIIASFRGDWELHQLLTEELYALRPAPLYAIILAMGQSRSDCGRVVDLLSQATPNFFAKSPEVPLPMLMSALLGVHCLREVGEVEQADRLLVASAKIAQRNRIAAGPRWVSGIEGVLLTVLQGEIEQGLEAFELLVSNGWRYYWWGLDSDPILKPLRSDPRFQKVLLALRENVAAERAWFEARRNMPLLP